MKNTILQDIRSVLNYHQECGIGNYPLTDGVKSFLSNRVPSDIQQSVPPKQYSNKTPGKEQNQEMPKRTVSNTATIEEIAEEVRTCQSCALSKKRIHAVPGAGGDNCKLFIVGGWLITDEASKGEGLVFGAEEDGMLSRMINAIQLEPSQVFITNLIKCGVASEVQPKSEHVDACISYLYRQIQALEPAVICTMGIIATQALLKVSKPLSQLRAHFHSFVPEKGVKIPLMPTYHPNFLLKNPEMKMATWQDLQQIEKTINEINGGQ